MGRQLGKIEGYQELPGEHQRPGPEEGGTAKRVAEGKQLEDGGQDGDEGEPGGKGREAAQPASELLAVAEASQVGAVVGALGHPIVEDLAHWASSPRPWRVVGRGNLGRWPARTRQPRVSQMARVAMSEVISALS